MLVVIVKMHFAFFYKREVSFLSYECYSSHTVYDVIKYRLLKFKN